MGKLKDWLAGQKDVREFSHPTTTLIMDDGNGNRQTFLVATASVTTTQSLNPIHEIGKNTPTCFLPGRTEISFTGVVLAQHQDKQVEVKPLAEVKEEFEAADRMDGIG